MTILLAKLFSSFVSFFPPLLFFYFHISLTLILVCSYRANILCIYFTSRFYSSLEHSTALAGTVILCHTLKEKKILHRLIIDLLTACLILKFFIFFYNITRKKEA